MLTAHKVAIYIIQYFIAIYVAVVVGGRYCIGVIIEQAGYKRAYYKIMRIECLVYWRRLVYAAGYGLKIVYAF